MSVWFSVRSFAEFGRVTADWLEGRVGDEYPNGLDVPDEERAALVPGLAAACRAGLVPLAAQAGAVYVTDGERQEQMAAVTGLLVDRALLVALAGQAWRQGLYVSVHRPAAHVAADGVPVTTVDGSPFTWLGQWIDPEDVEIQFEGCHPDVVAAAVDAWQVTVIDLTVGRNDRLWPAIDAAVGRVTAPA